MWYIHTMEYYPDIKKNKLGVGKKKKKKEQTIEVLCKIFQGLQGVMLCEKSPY